MGWIFSASVGPTLTKYSLNLWAMTDLSVTVLLIRISRQVRIATFIQDMLDNFPGVLDACFKFLKRLNVMQQLNKFVPVGFVFVISVIIRILNEVFI